MINSKNACTLALATLLVLSLSGCLQIETNIQVHEDGSATLTERVRFSRRLLDLASDKSNSLAGLLNKESALERMGRMGTGLKLVSHQVRDAEGASRESLTVYKVADLNNLEYVSPWPDLADFSTNNQIKFTMQPLYKCGSSGGQVWAGQIRIAIQHIKAAKRTDYRNEDQIKPPRPVDLQVYRDIGPVFQDLMKDFMVKLTIDAYCPLVPSSGSPPIRDLRAGARTVDLINFTSKDLDSWGGTFLGNEELMVELFRFNLDGKNINTHVRGYVSNKTLPVIMSRGRGNTSVYVRPSRILFDRYFKGKMLDYRPWTKNPPVPAVFEKIGWTEPRKKSTKTIPAKKNPPAKAKK